MSDLILGVDPGGKTGVVVFDPRELQVVAHAQLQVKDAQDNAWAVWLQRMVPKVWMVAAERFVISGRTIRHSRQHDALDVLGALRYLCAVEGTQLNLQSASDAKSAFPNEMLMTVGQYEWVQGPHARDALRHALLATRRLYGSV